MKNDPHYLREYRKRDPFKHVQCRVPPERRQELLDIAAQMRADWIEENVEND